MGNRRTWATRLGLDVPARVGKYGARATWVDGIRFDSLKEARRYRDLSVLATARAIRDLECQPRFPLVITALHGDPPARQLCGMYTADFRYVELETGEVVVEDVKSGPTKTTAYQLRKRIAEALYGITIREV